MWNPPVIYCHSNTTNQGTPKLTAHPRCWQSKPLRAESICSPHLRAARGCFPPQWLGSVLATGRQKIYDLES